LFFSFLYSYSSLANPGAPDYLQPFSFLCSSKANQLFGTGAEGWQPIIPEAGPRELAARFGLAFPLSKVGHQEAEQLATVQEQVWELSPDAMM
jgi:hypothetical protein